MEEEKSFRRHLRNLLRADRDGTGERGSSQEDSSNNGTSKLHDEEVTSELLARRRPNTTKKCPRNQSEHPTLYSVRNGRVMMHVDVEQGALFAMRLLSTQVRVLSLGSRQRTRRAHDHSGMGGVVTRSTF